MAMTMACTGVGSEVELRFKTVWLERDASST